MGLKDKISEDLKEAMRAKDPLRRDTVRAIRGAILNAEKEGRREALKDEDILDLIRREAKKRREAAEQFEKGGRPELAEKEKGQLAILEGYLPRQLDRDAIAGVVGPIVDEMGVKGDPAKLGLVMREVMPRLKGKADGKLVNQVVRELIQ